MTNLNERIEQVLKLDAERTHEKWRIIQTGHKKENDFLGVDTGIQMGSVGGFSIHKMPNATNNIRFIAAAPEMASIIREQRELLRYSLRAAEAGLLCASVLILAGGGAACEISENEYKTLANSKRMLEQAGITSEQGSE